MIANRARARLRRRPHGFRLVLLPEEASLNEEYRNGAASAHFLSPTLIHRLGR